MKVNGKTVALEAPILLKDFLSQAGYTAQRIAVERNGEIIPKAEYDSTFLTEADCLEIVHFVGGG